MTTQSRSRASAEISLEQAAIPITVRVREACRLTGIGRSKLYMLIQEGHIETIKVGSMTLIPMSSLKAFLGQAAR